jgi:predicted metal-binding protein
MDKNFLEQQLSELPLYTFFYTDPANLEFSDRIRYICQAECPRFGKSWACPPAVGSVAECEGKCRRYNNCLMIATITEVADIANIEETLATRPEHEAITNTVRDRMRELGVDPYVLSTEACAECERCAYLDGKACRFPERMHPCVESHGINLVPVLEENGIEFQFGANVVTWVSLLFYN